MKQKVALCGAALIAALVLAPIAVAAELDEVPDDAGFVVAGSRSNSGAGVVRVRADDDGNGTYERLSASFDPYPGSSVGDGVRVAAGDLDGDGNEELVTAAGTALPVKVFELNPDGTIGSLRESFRVFPSRGVFVAVGDVDGDLRDELVTAAGSGRPPTVRIWSDTDLDGRVFDNQVDSFNAYGATFSGGVRVAVGNVNNLGGEEVVTAQGPPGRVVRVWTDADADRAVSDQPFVDQLTMYSATFKGGLYVAAGPIENVGGGGAEVIVSPGPSSGPARKVVIRTDTDNDGNVSDNPAAESFFAYGSGWKQGVRVGAGDTDHSGSFVEVLTGPGVSAGSRLVKLYDDVPTDPDTLISNNALDHSFVSMPASVRAGAYVTHVRVRAVSYVRQGFPQGIPENGTLTSELWVPASGGILRDLDVSLNIFHTFNGDLDVTLVHVPSGRSVVLFTDVGGTDEGFVIRLNDESSTDIGTADNPADGAIAGQFNPEGDALLSTFDGVDASGLWRLIVTDDNAAGADVGTLFSWTLHATY